MGVTKSEGHRTVSDGTKVFTRRWTPEGERVGSIVLVHGVGEHSGRYENVGEHLAGAGYSLCAIDLRGHGRSDGARGDTRFDAVFGDLDEVLADERGRAGAGPLFLYGHSLGGLISLAYALDRRPALAGLVASASALHLTPQRLKFAVARALGRLLPTLTVSSGLDPQKLTRDPAELAEYLADPLVHRRASFGLGRDVLTAIERVLADAARIEVPLLLIHGGADRVNAVSGSEAVAAQLGDRCTLRVYEGVLHKPHKDPESPRILGEIVEWLDARRAAGAAAA